MKTALLSCNTDFSVLWCDIKLCNHTENAMKSILSCYIFILFEIKSFFVQCQMHQGVQWEYKKVWNLQKVIFLTWNTSIKQKYIKMKRMKQVNSDFFEPRRKPRPHMIALNAYLTPWIFQTLWAYISETIHFEDMVFTSILHDFERAIQRTHWFWNLAR